MVYSTRVLCAAYALFAIALFVGPYLGKNVIQTLNVSVYSGIAPGDNRHLMRNSGFMFLILVAINAYAGLNSRNTQLQTLAHYLNLATIMHYAVETFIHHCLPLLMMLLLGILLLVELFPHHNSTEKETMHKA